MYSDSGEPTIAWMTAMKKNKGHATKGQVAFTFSNGVLKVNFLTVLIENRKIKLCYFNRLNMKCINKAKAVASLKGTLNLNKSTSHTVFFRIFLQQQM